MSLHGGENTTDLFALLSIVFSAVARPYTVSIVYVIGVLSRLKNKVEVLKEVLR